MATRLSTELPKKATLLYVVQVLIESQAKLDIKNNVSVELLVACMGMGS